MIDIITCVGPDYYGKCKLFYRVDFHNFTIWNSNDREKLNVLRIFDMYQENIIEI